MPLTRAWPFLVLPIVVAAVAVALTSGDGGRDRRSAAFSLVVGRPDRGPAPRLTLGRLPASAREAAELARALG